MENESKGLYKRLQENVVNYDPSKGLTLEELRKAIWELYEYGKNRKYRIELPAHDYPSLSDEEFEAFLRGSTGLEGSYDVIFMGGLEGCNRMQTRVERQGLQHLFGDFK